MEKAFYQFETIYETETSSDLHNLGIINDDQSIEYGRIFIDVNEIETINESGKEGYITIRLHSGYSCMIKWSMNKLLKLINNST